MAVTVDPLCVTVAFHPLVTLTPDGTVQVDRQLLAADDPELVSVASAVKPLPHELVTLCAARQEPGPGLGFGSGSGLECRRPEGSNPHDEQLLC